MTRAERREVDARIAALEEERDCLTALLLWYAESRRRWMAVVEDGDRRIYSRTGGRLHGPRETLPEPEIGCIDRPDLKVTHVKSGHDDDAWERDDDYYYARDINSW